MELQTTKQFQQIDMFHGYCMTGSNTDHNNHHTFKEEYKIWRIGIDDRIRDRTNDFEDVYRLFYTACNSVFKVLRLAVEM
jgi:hypothetical protein